MPGSPEKCIQKENPLLGELQVVFVPLPPDRRLTWRFGMATVYAVLDNYLAREHAAAEEQEAK
jgi:hypothetical protein